MKILHLIFSFNVGGAESMLVDIANRQALNNDVYVYVINSMYDQDMIDAFDKMITVHLFNRKVGSKNIFKIMKINFDILKLNPDIIHCHDSNIIDMLFVHNLFKTVLTVHALNLALKGIEKYNQVIAISETVKEHLIKRKIANVFSVYNGIDTSLIKPKNKQCNCDVFNMVQIGRLDHQNKGQHILIKALHELKKSNISNFHVDFIGEGDSLVFLQDLVSKLNLEDNVTFLGIKKRSYIYSHLKEYDLLIQPSIFEGFGLTVAEGMAANLPVLVSANDGPLEIINYGQYGYYFNKEDITDCANKIKWIMNSPNEVYEKSAKGYEYAVRMFDINDTVSNYQKIYTKNNNHIN